MKNLLLAGLMLFSISLSYSQETEATENLSTDPRDTNSNELSLNAFNVVAFGALEIVYERVISENSTWALEAFVNLNNEDSIDDAYEKDLSLTGKYKHFFSSSHARGFYVHGFGMLSGGEQETDYFYDSIRDEGYYEYESYTDFAIGFGIGGKFISQGGFLLDLSTGIGRNLFSDRSPEIVGQFMVNLGIRF
jgi:hypothetical protein